MEVRVLGSDENLKTLVVGPLRVQAWFIDTTTEGLRCARARTQPGFR